MSITRRGLRLRVYVYKGLYISLLKNKYCISYYTAIIVELVFPVNYFVYHIEIHLVVTLLGTSPFRIPASVLQYGVLSSFPSNWRSSHSPSSIVGLMRFCLGFIVTSNDLPPDLHSNHIEIHSSRCTKQGRLARPTTATYCPHGRRMYFNMIAHIGLSLPLLATAPQFPVNLHLW
jgi:hypothetical protein